MSAVVVVPLSIVDDARGRAWAFVRSRLVDDGWPIVTGVQRSAGGWCKADAVSDALRSADVHAHADDVLVVHDADVVVDLAALREAVELVESGAVEWAVPHTLVYRLSEQTTLDYLAGVTISIDSRSTTTLTRWPYVGVAGGGIVCVRRSTYADCPLDRRFVGWGGEDQAWGWALSTLHGEPRRVDAPLVHLWHPHAAPGAQRPPRVESERLVRAYRAYRRWPEQMRVLVDETRSG